jgi:hypothetical protein
VRNHWQRPFLKLTPSNVTYEVSARASVSVQHKARIVRIRNNIKTARTESETKKSSVLSNLNRPRAQ